MVSPHSDLSKFMILKQMCEYDIEKDLNVLTPAKFVVNYPKLTTRHSTMYLFVKKLE